jgi:hypothetical protein
VVNGISVLISSNFNSILVTVGLYFYQINEAYTLQVNRSLISIPFLLPIITLISQIFKKNVAIILKLNALKIRIHSKIR